MKRDLGGAEFGNSYSSFTRYYFMCVGCIT